MRTLNRRILVGLWAVVFLAAQTGCDASKLVERRETLAAQHVAGTALDVATQNGDIVVEQSDRDDVQIEATIRAETKKRAEATKIVVARGADQTLSVRVEWPDGRKRGSEACSFAILIPDVNGIALESDNGRLSIADLAGQANLHTNNGAIEVDRHAGPVVANTLNGQVSIRDAMESVTAEATNGALQIALAPESPGPVNLKTTNGMIDLVVGPAFAGELTIGTTLGMISVDDSIQARPIAEGPHQATLAFGAEGQPTEQKSSATTVNGMIHVGWTDGPNEIQ